MNADCEQRRQAEKQMMQKYAGGQAPGGAPPQTEPEAEDPLRKWLEENGLLGELAYLQDYGVESLDDVSDIDGNSIVGLMELGMKPFKATIKLVKGEHPRILVIIESHANC